MTSQPKRSPKTAFFFLITNENYDFLYQVAKKDDASLAKALNRLIDTHRSNIGIRETSKERVMVSSNGRCHSERYGCQ